MITPTDDHETTRSGSVIDLREGPTTRIRVERGHNPFESMPPAERMRLIVRVLCELVAYDELEPDATDDHRTQHDTAAEVVEPTPQASHSTG